MNLQYFVICAAPVIVCCCAKVHPLRKIHLSKLGNEMIRVKSRKKTLEMKSPKVLTNKVYDHVVKLASEHVTVNNEPTDTCSLKGNEYRYPEDIYPHLKKCLKRKKNDKETLAKGHQGDEILEEDKSNSRKKKLKKKSRIKETPNYFLSVQMTNQQIHSKIEEIQNLIVAQKDGLKSTMVSVKKLHLTLAVYNLKDESDISKARDAMNDFSSAWKSKSQPLINISVSGIGNFRHQVVFASLSEDSEFEQLKVLVSHIRTAFEEAGLKATDDRFSPHVTIAKMSKLSQKLRKQGIKKIEDKLYEDVKSTYFGQQVVDKIQLCSMNKPEDKHGYYYVEYDIDM